MSDVHNTTAAPAEAPLIAEPVVIKPEETIVDPVEETANPIVHETPAIAATEPIATEHFATEAPAAIEEVPVTESAPAVETSAIAAEETPVAATLEEPKAIDSGILGYKAPGLIKSLKFSKRSFWLGEEPVSVDNLSTYLRGEKPETGNATAAWSSHTGKGLLYFVKHADEKKHPQGVLNLSEATDLEKATGHEFTFKIHHHKHAFKAASDAERDAWFVAIEQAMIEAKANKDTITSSESYKETFAGLVKSHAPHTGAGRKSMDASRSRGASRPRATSTSSSSSSDAEAAAKKAKKSRSASRNGKRHSLFGGIMGKKAEHDVEKEDKKEEKAIEAGLPATEAVEASVVAETVAPLEAEAIAARVIDAPIEEVKLAEEKPIESVVEPTIDVPSNVEEVPVSESAALVESAAIAAEEKPVEVAAVEEKPIVNSVSSKPIEEKKKTEERPKTNKRSSLFGAFFDKVRSPTSEKKESEVAPVVPAKETVVSAEPPVLPETTTENSNLDPSAVETTAVPAVAEPVVEAPRETELEGAKVETPLVRPEAERKQSFFDSLVKKARSKSPAPGTAATDAPAVPPKDNEVVAAPIVDAPATTTEVVAEKPIEEPIVPVTETKIETPKGVTPKENRRKSYFGGFGGAKKEKTDVESPQEDKSMLGKVTGLFRTKSQAARPVKKENVAPTEPIPAIPATETVTEPTVVDTPAVVEPKVEESVVDATPLVESQHTHSNPTVSAAA